MKVLVSEEQLRGGVTDLARRIADDYQGKPLMLVGILQDSIILLADLMRSLEIPCQMRIAQPMWAHVGPDKPSRLNVANTTSEAVQHHHILLVENVFDTGYTVLEVTCALDGLHPLSVNSAALLKKQGCQQTNAGPNYVVFEIPDETVVGYGLDYHGYYRNLPFVAALEDGDTCAYPATPGVAVHAN